MAFPSIPTPAVGDPWTATTVQGIYDMVAALYSPPGCNLYNSAGLTCTAGTWVLLTMDGEVWDEDWAGAAGTWHSTSTNTSRLTFPYDGTYELTLMWQWASVPGADNGIAQLRLNAAGSVTGGTALRTIRAGADRTNSYTVRRAFSAGDYAEAWIQSTSSTIVASGGAHVLGMAARWLAYGATVF